MTKNKSSQAKKTYFSQDQFGTHAHREVAKPVYQTVVKPVTSRDKYLKNASNKLPDQKKEKKER